MSLLLRLIEHHCAQVRCYFRADCCIAALLLLLTAAAVCRLVQTSTGTALLDALCAALYLFLCLLHLLK
jgi:hypothetical protein